MAREVTSELVRSVSAEVDRLAPALHDLSHRIHANPELGHEERQASAWCTELLREHGFEVTAPFGGLETAFRARASLGATAASGSITRARRRSSQKEFSGGSLWTSWIAGEKRALAPPTSSPPEP